jgi:hypothetical protein
MRKFKVECLFDSADGVKKSRLPEIMNALIGRMGFSR